MYIKYLFAFMVMQYPMYVFSQNPLIAYNVSGGGSICEGTSITVRLSDSQEGINYNIFLNGTLLPSMVKFGTGSSLLWIGLPGEGTYTIRAGQRRNSLQMNGSAAIIIIPLPANPPSPIVSNNTCGSKELKRGMKPPSGIKFYWQGTNQNGHNIDNSLGTYAAQTSGTYYIRAKTDNGCWSAGSGQTPVTVNPSPGIPATPSVSSNLCGDKTLSSVSPPANISWYWQGTNASGTNTGNSGESYAVLNSGDYYLRARSSSGCWSENSAQVNVPINKLPVTPPSPNSSSNNCGDKTLSHAGSPPAGTSWYWQGTNSGPKPVLNYGASTSLTVSEPGTYYIRARSSAGCWSSQYASVSVQVKPIPVMPSAPIISENLCGDKKLTHSNPPGGVKWYWQGTAEDGNSTSNSDTYTVSSSGTYYLRARTDQGCWSSESSNANVSVNPIPPNPPAPLSSGNQCGSKNLSRGVKPTQGILYYWQGTNSDGTNTQNSQSSFTAQSSGTYYIRAMSMEGCWSLGTGILAVEVNDFPPAPAIPSVSTNKCGDKIISKSASPPGIEYYWQGNDQSGISTEFIESEYSVSESGSYYLRAISSEGCWSQNSTSIVVNIIKKPHTPDIPLVSSNLCGPRELSYSQNPPSGVEWYWQGTDPGPKPVLDFGKKPIFEVESSGTHYIRSRNAEGCWSNLMASVEVQVNNIPVAPETPAQSQNVCGEKTLKLSVPPSMVTYYWQGTNPEGINIDDSNDNYTVSESGNYYLRAQHNNGCWSASSALVSIIIVENMVPGALSGDQKICPGATAEKITGSLPSLGSGIIEYNWEAKTVGGNWNQIPHNNEIDFQPGQIFEPINVRRKDTDAACGYSVYGNEVTIDFYNDIKPGEIAGSQEVFSESTTNPLTSILPGQSETVSITYTWQKSFDSNSWYDLPNSNTDNYYPGSFGENVFFRRKVSDLCYEDHSNILKINVWQKPVIQNAGSSDLSANTKAMLSVPDKYDTYLWEINGQPIRKNEAVLGTNAPGKYRVVVTCPAGEISSDEYILNNSIDNQEFNFIRSFDVKERNVFEVYEVYDQTERMVRSSIVYIDGLGKPMQDIQLNFTSIDVDLVSPISYDELGRESIKYLGYAGSTEGLFQDNALGSLNYSESDQSKFYLESEKVAWDNKPYTRTLYESSPLQRVIAEGGPGETWQPEEGKAIRYQYATNKTHEVIKWNFCDVCSLPERLNKEVQDQVISNSLEFDGVDDYVALDMFFEKSGALPEFTVEAWVNTIESGKSWTDNWAILDFDRSEYFNLFVRGDNGKIGFSTTDINGKIHDMYSMQTINDGEWHHVAAVYNGTDKLIYIDGVLDSGKPDIHQGRPIGRNTAPKRYGFIGDGSEASSFNGNRNKKYYKGNVSDIRLWSYARSNTEIVVERSNKYVDFEEGLLAYYPMRVGAQSTILTDFSGFNHEGTLFNMDLVSSRESAVLFHDSGILNVKETTDENGNIFREYTDLQNRLLLRKSFLNEDSIETYYIYDDLNRLRIVLQPEGLVRFDNEYYMNPEAFLDRYAFQYDYDQRGRVIRKKVPGSSWNELIYDSRDRIVLSQDGNQKEAEQWIFTKYDFLNRPVVTGNYFTQLNVDSLRSLVRLKSFKTHEARGQELYGYTNQSFPKDVQMEDILIVYYYDDYEFIKNDIFTNDNRFSFQIIGEGFTDNYKDFANGKQTGSITKILNQSLWLKHVNYYDDKLRLIQEINEFSNGSLMIKASAYDFNNQLHYLRTMDKANTPEQVKTDEWFEYDLYGRLIDVYHRVNNGEAVNIKHYEYNKLGQMTDKKLHVKNEVSAQSMDHRYNIRGWLTHINNAALENDGVYNNESNDYFGMELSYDENENNDIKQFNGNISGVKWNVAAGYFPMGKRYSFHYDQLNRLLAASYGENVTNNWGDRSGFFDATGFSYDHNGNIETLNRWGGSEFKEKIDELVYQYDGNQLLAVEDRGNKVIGFKDGTSLSVEYLYDRNGNMKADRNKSIQHISYNFLNLTDTIFFENGNSIVFEYDALGRKLAKTVFKEGQPGITEYHDNFQYCDDSLTMILMSEGRIVPGNDNQWVYDYFLKDHLGNTRVVFSTEPRRNFYVATMEGAFSFNEERVFEGISANRQTRLYMNHTPETAIEPNPNKAAYLNGLDKVVGPAKMLEVHAGDTVSVKVYGKYLHEETNFSEVALSVLAGQLGTTFGGLNGLDASMVSDLFENVFGIYSPISSENGQVPEAYLNYILFDRSFNVVTGGFDQIGEEAGFYGYEENISEFDSLFFEDLLMDVSGYLYIYIINQSTGSNVWFDDLTITHTEINPIIQVTDYYPFGMEIGTSYQQSGKQENKFLYNGKELQTDLNLDWYDYGARMYDAAIGRWHVVDNVSERYYSLSPYEYTFNNPIRFIDPDGNDPNDVLNKAKSYVGTPYEWGGKNPASSWVGIKSSNRVLNSYYSAQSSLFHKDNNWSASDKRDLYDIIGNIPNGNSYGIDCSGVAGNAFNADPDKLMGDLQLGNANKQMEAFEEAGDEGTGTLHQDFNYIGKGDLVFNVDSKGNAKHSMVATGKVKYYKDGNVKRYQVVNSSGSGNFVSKSWKSVSSTSYIGHTYRKGEQSTNSGNSLADIIKSYINMKGFKQQYQNN